LGKDVFGTNSKNHCLAYVDQPLAAGIISHMILCHWGPTDYNWRVVSCSTLRLNQCCSVIKAVSSIEKWQHRSRDDMPLPHGIKTSAYTGIGK